MAALEREPHHACGGGPMVAVLRAARRHGRHGGRRAQIRGLRRRLWRQIVRRRLRERRIRRSRAHDDDERDRRRRAGRPRAHGARSRGAAARRAGPAADAVVSATGRGLRHAAKAARTSRVHRPAQSRNDPLGSSHRSRAPPRRSRTRDFLRSRRPSRRRSPSRSSVLTPLVEGVGSGGRRKSDVTDWSSRAGRRGLLLPQVPAEWHWSREEFLEQTCRKAGLPRDAWRHGADVFSFEAEIFDEEALMKRPALCPACGQAHAVAHARRALRRASDDRPLRRVSWVLVRRHGAPAPRRLRHRSACSRSSTPNAVSGTRCPTGRPARAAA